MAKKESTKEDASTTRATLGCCPQLEPCEVCDVLNFTYRLPFRPLVQQGTSGRWSQLRSR